MKMVFSTWSHMRIGWVDIRKEIKMNQCCNCGYMWADCDSNGKPITNEYCHCHETGDVCPVEYDEYLEWAREEQ